ncbi:MAG TPA: DUF4382 domain-containing protein [Flavobacteriia bacterium]|nr:DUF4382 domain-containing protein [Flavobacteriia bacterium]
MKKTIKLFVLSLLLSGVFVACNSNDDNPSNNDNKGAVNVQITDAPFPIDFVTQANVGVAKVELKNQNGEYVTVFEGNASYNMVNLTNGTTETVTTNNVEIGTYTEAKVTLNDASVNLSDGNTFDLSTEAQGSYNVTIDPPLVVEDNVDSDLLLDLDLNHSFTFSTNMFMNWITDVLDITGCTFDADFRACDLDQSGKIEGSIKTSSDIAIANALVEVNMDGEEVTTLSDSNGNFTFIGVKPGNYTVHVTTQNNGEVDVQNVSVSVSNTTSVTATLN